MKSLLFDLKVTIYGLVVLSVIPGLIWMVNWVFTNHVMFPIFILIMFLTGFLAASLGLFINEMLGIIIMVVKEVTDQNSGI